MKGQLGLCDHEHLFQSVESIAEIYHILTEEERSQRIKKKTKKAQKKSDGEPVRSLEHHSTCTLCGFIIALRSRRR